MGPEVMVLDGQVHVQSGPKRETLMAGQLIAAAPSRTEITWSQNAVELLPLQLPALPPAPPLPQATNGVVQGIVTRAGTSEGIPEVSIALCLSGRSVTDASQLPPRNSIAEIRIISQVGENQIPLTTFTPDGRSFLFIRQRDGASITLPQTPDCSEGLKAATDSAGRFTIRDVPLGQYSVRAQREGYFPQAETRGNPSGWNVLVRNLGEAQNSMYSGPIVVDGQITPDVTLSMVRGGAVSGHVRDAQGRPAANVTVWARGPVSATQRVAARTTDDRGEFRLFWLPPGDYYIAANPAGDSADFARSLVIVNGRSTLGGGFAGSVGRRQTAPGEPSDTFYPSAASLEDATKITIREGEDVTGVDIALRPAPPAR